MTSQRGHQLATRIAWVAVSSAALGALMAALLAIGTVDRLLADQADLRLRGAVIELAGELDEDLGQLDRNRLRRELEDENEEIAPSNIRLSVFHEGALIAGVAESPPPEVNSCRSGGALGQRLRACSKAYGSWLLVAELPSDTGHLRWMYFVAVLGAMVLGGSTGALLSRAIAPWAARPLATLAKVLRGPAQQSEPEDFGPPSACQEVEAVRLALAERTAQMQQLLDQAGRFAADAAHELRTPLTTLRAELELLREDTNASADALDKVLQRVTRLSELVDRLLILALPGTGVSQNFETVGMGEVVEGVVSDLNEADRRCVELQLESEGLVRGDSELIYSLVSNAVSNALRFRSQRPVTISVRSGTEGDVVLSVRDRGPGVPPALRQQVFLPFQRARPARGTGHGLGLALISHIVRVHGGSVQFVDVEPGACLEVRLPAWTGQLASTNPGA